jgi:hypothetical protein
MTQIELRRQALEALTKTLGGTAQATIAGAEVQTNRVVCVNVRR